MKYPWLDEYCMSKQGAAKEYKDEWKAERYMAGGKMLDPRGNGNTGRPIIYLELSPADGDFFGVNLRI